MSGIENTAASSGASPPPRPTEGTPTLIDSAGAAAPAAPTTSPTSQTQSIPREARPEIPDVVLEKEIGRGGMGVVYVGRQPYLDRRVAVKVLPVRAGTLDSTQFVERFRREARILAGLAHPNIVTCHNAGTTAAGDCFLVMEFVDGPNLRDWIAEHEPLVEAHALEVVRDIALALAHARTSGIIHRDVKPENILLAKNEKAVPGGFPFTAKLVDLGLARRPDAGDEKGRITTQGMVVGTPQTMAPEQFDDPEHVDFRADIYGLGCVLFHAVTGGPAFPDKAISSLIASKLRGEPPDPRPKNAELSEALAQLVRDMLAPSRDDRPQSYDVLIERCEKLLQAAAGRGQVVNQRKRMTGLVDSQKLAALASAETKELGAATPPAKTGKSTEEKIALGLFGIVVLGGLAVGGLGAFGRAGPGTSSEKTPSPSASPSVAPSTPAAPLEPRWGAGEPLFGAKFLERLKGWERVPPSAQFAPEEEDGPGIYGQLTGRITYPLGRGPWRVEGRLFPTDKGECGVRIEHEGGSASLVAIQKLKDFLATAYTEKAGVRGNAWHAASVKGSGPEGELPFVVSVYGGQARIEVGSTIILVGDVQLPAAAISLYVVNSNGTRFRDVVVRKPEQ